MPRPKRDDQPGACYHVMNRGVARRTIFDSRSDFRFFLAGIARAVRREELEALAYALMGTHFHLFVKSLGGLSTAMRRIQQRHSRRFNRLHGRDGPLVRNRFLAIRVRRDRHAHHVVRYIHENPVAARICRRPEEYEWSSAAYLAGRRIPKWFSDLAIRRHGLDGGRVAIASEAAMAARAELVEARLMACSQGEDEELDAGTAEGIIRWMRRKAMLADGSVSHLPEVGPKTLVMVLRTCFPSVTKASTPVPGGGTYPTGQLLLAGLLRDVCACSFPEIISIMRLGESRATRLCRLHRRCLQHLTAYADLAGAVIERCLGILGEGLPSPDGFDS
jgi:REP element-mobilizing transposase RayT